MVHAVSVDLERSLVHYGGGSMRLRGARDAAFLHALARGGHTTPQSAITAAQMAQLLKAAGLRAPKDGTQWARILERVCGALDELDPSLALSAHLRHPVRAKTTGPWWWEPACAGHVAELAPAVGAGPAMPRTAGSAAARSVVPASLGLSVDPLDTSAPALLQRLKLGLEAHWKADLVYAAEVLADDAGWAGETPALALLRRWRLAEVQMAVGRHADAEATLAQCMRACSSAELQQLFVSHLRMSSQRLAYARHPVQVHAALLRRLRAEVDRVATPGQDAMLAGERLHLMMLCARRAVEEAAQAGTPPARRLPMLRTLFIAGHAAIVHFLVARNPDRAQHVCANLAYAHQRLSVLGDSSGSGGLDHTLLALRWHRLSFGLHASFGGAENSAWEYIYLGELWLNSPQARTACRQSWDDGSWNDISPATPAFYAQGCRVARLIGEPRQLAYTLINQARFLKEHQSWGPSEAAWTELRQLLRAHPDVRRVLASEGYDMPGRSRRP